MPTQPPVVIDGLDRVSVQLEPADAERPEINPAGMRSHRVGLAQ
jgi:hypothetical protein